MKKNYLLFITSILIASVLLIIPGCEEEESDSDNIFTLTDNGYFSADFGVILHDAANPTSDPIASALVEQGGTIVFTKDSLTVDAGDVSSLIVTTVEYYDENDISRLTSNWFVEKGAAWNQVGDKDVINFDANEVSVTIEAPEGLNIVAYFNDIGDYSYSITNSYGSEYTTTHYVSAVDNDEKITITSVAKMDDGNYYFGLLEDQAWADGLNFTIDDWQAGVIDPINVIFTENPDADYMNFRSFRTSPTYAIDGERTAWNTHYQNSSYPDTLNNNISLMTTDAIPHTDKTRILVYWSDSDNYATEPYTRSFYADYGDFEDGDIASYKEMNLSFDFSSTTGSMLNIEADDDIDQMRFHFSASLDGDYFSWYHYFDPNESDRFDVPYLSDDLGLSDFYSLRVVDYDNFEGSADIVESLFEKNDFWTSWTDRHINFIQFYFDDGQQNRAIPGTFNHSLPERDRFGYDLFGMEEPGRVKQ